MGKVDDNYVTEAVNSLSDQIGIGVDADAQQLISLLQSRRVKECARAIARHLGLPIDINLSYVPAGYTFHSTHLVRADPTGRRSEAITAQVSIPSDLPLYGTAGLDNFPITVTISENCTDNPAAFITVMAHEFSHIVLHSLLHPERDNEVYTDVTAMLLGFSKIMGAGRKVTKTVDHHYGTEVHTTTYGYLSDAEFHLAKETIEGLVASYREAEHRLIQGIKHLEKRVEYAKRLITYFRKYLEYVDTHRGQSMSQQDGSRMCVFHQAGYGDDLEVVTRTTESQLRQFVAFVRGPHYRDGSRYKQIGQYEKTVGALARHLRSSCQNLSGDVRIVRRYVSLGFRLRMFLETRYSKAT